MVRRRALALPSVSNSILLTPEEIAEYTGYELSVAEARYSNETDWNHR